MHGAPRRGDGGVGAYLTYLTPTMIYDMEDESKKVEDNQSDKINIKRSKGDEIYEAANWHCPVCTYERTPSTLARAASIAKSRGKGKPYKLPLGAYHSKGTHEGSTRESKHVCAQRGDFLFPKPAYLAEQTEIDIYSTRRILNTIFL